MSPEYIVFHVINTVSFQYMRAGDSAMVCGSLLGQLKEMGSFGSIPPVFWKVICFLDNIHVVPKVTSSCSLFTLSKKIYLFKYFVCLSVCFKLFFVKYKICFNGWSDNVVAVLGFLCRD